MIYVHYIPPANTHILCEMYEMVPARHSRGPPLPLYNLGVNLAHSLISFKIPFKVHFLCRLGLRVGFLYRLGFRSRVSSAHFCIFYLADPGNGGPREWRTPGMTDLNRMN